MNQILGGRYQFIRVLKSSAVGQTYLAEDLQASDQATRIVKRLQVASKNPRTQRFVSILLRKKAEALSSFSCDQVPKIFDFFEDSTGFYIIEEYVPGTLLSNELIEGVPLGETAVIQILEDILDVLVVVHGWGVIHRCIEPRHFIRREADQRLVLIGFGIFQEISAQVMRSQTPPLPLPLVNSIYFPPEQTQGQLQFNSDIYAVGMIGIQALTGLSADNLAKLRSTESNGSGAPRLLWRGQAEVSEALADILDRMVHPASHQRYQLAADVLADLKRLQQGNTEPSAERVTVIETPMPKPNRQVSKQSPRWLVPTLLAVAAVVGGGVLMMSQVPQSWLAQRSLRQAQQYQQAGSLPAAIAQYNQALELYPSSEVYYGRGKVYQEMGELQEALEDFRQAITLDPTNADAYYQRGNVRFGLGDGQGAIADYTEAIRNQPQNARAYVNRGSVRAELGDDLGAVEDYTQAIQIDPNLGAAYLNRCLSRSNVGEHQTAIADCTQAINLQPNSVLAYQNRGLVRRRVGDIRGAIEDLNIAIRLDPDDPDPYYNRGLARYELGDRMGAIADYTDAIRRNPDHVFAYYDRGLMYVEANDVEAAINDFQQAAKLCLDSGRTACYEDAQYQINLLRGQTTDDASPSDPSSTFDSSNPEPTNPS